MYITSYITDPLIIANKFLVDSAIAIVTEESVCYSSRLIRFFTCIVCTVLTSMPKRKSRTFEEKLKILKFVEDDEMKMCDIGEKFSIMPQTVSDLIKSLCKECCF